MELLLLDDKEDTPNVIGLCFTREEASLLSALSDVTIAWARSGDPLGSFARELNNYLTDRCKVNHPLNYTYKPLYSRGVVVKNGQISFAESTKQDYE